MFHMLFIKCHSTKVWVMYLYCCVVQSYYHVFCTDGTMLLSCASDFTIKLMDITKEIIVISYSLTNIVRYNVYIIHHTVHSDQHTIYRLVCCVFRCFVWDDSVVVAGTDAGNIIIVQLYPSPKIINLLGGSSGMYMIKLCHFINCESLYTALLYIYVTQSDKMGLIVVNTLNRCLINNLYLHFCASY